MTAVNTALIAPWSTDSADLIAQTIGHVSTASVVMPDGESFDLDLEDGTVSWDETRTPRVTASLRCRVPDDQALLARIDPRTGARLTIQAGYARRDGTTDLQPLADLMLRGRAVSRPGDLMSLDAAGDEALLIDGAGTSSGNVSAASTTAAIGAIIAQIFSPYPTVVVPAFSPNPAISGLLFEDRWDAINDLSDRVGAQVYDNGLRAWYISPAPVVAAPALTLTVGAGGTLIGSDATTTRDPDFGNYVWLQYTWETGTTTTTRNVINALRRVSTGPYAAVAGNLKILRFARSVSATQAEANAAADALVARTVTRGRSFDLDAISAYWLRPGHTVEVTLPAGDAEAHLVTAVDFDLRAGRMRVTTRLPDGSYTIGA